MKIKKQTINNVRAFTLNEKSVFDDEKLMIAGVVISNGTKDSYGTTFNPAGIDTKRFEKNPVLLLNHNDWNGLSIGRVENIRQESEDVVADVFFEDVTKEAKGKDVYNLLKGKFLNGFSVRFNVLRWGNEKNGEHTFEEWELLEVSVVNIPSNPDAVVKRSAETIVPETSEIEDEEDNYSDDEEKSEEVKIGDIRAIVCETFKKIKKVEDDKRQVLEVKEQLTTDIRAALVNCYKTLGKTLKSLKSNK